MATAYQPPVALVDDVRVGVASGAKIDYRWWRYSKIALPFLVLLLCWFATILCLTLWQGGFSIKGIQSGIPRDLELYAEDPDNNHNDAIEFFPKPVRNVHLAAATFALFFVFLAALVYYVGFKKFWNNVFTTLTAVGLLLTGVFSIVVFAVTVHRPDEVRECHTQVGITGEHVRSCQEVEEYGIALATLSAVVATLSILGGLMLFFMRKAFAARRNDLVTENDADAIIQEQIPYQHNVYKKLLFLTFFTLAIAAVLMLVFVVLVHELRERVNGETWDPINKQTFAGWPRENTRLRLGLSVIGVLLVILSILPYAHRVYVYLLAFGFFVTGVCFFVAFGIDLKDYRDARDLGCPTTSSKLTCNYDPYVTLLLFDFFAGVFTLVYVFVEFCAHKKNSHVQAVEDFGYEEDVGIDEFGLAPAEKQAAPLPPNGGLKPLLGLQLIEAADPTTNEMLVQVTQVTAGGAADEAGIRQGDRITQFNGAVINTKADFASAVNNANIGSSVPVQVGRSGQFGPVAESLRMIVRAA